MDRRARCRRIGGAAAVASLAVAVAAGPGHAATVTAAGWWTSTPVALAPDAGPGSLVIEGGIDEPRSYAAVHYVLAANETASTLRLQVAPGAASTPNTVLELCVLGEPFVPARGGPVAQAPAFDCAISVEAPAASDGTTYTFDVSGLVIGRELAVAILPTAATDRVVLFDPTADGLSTDVAPLPAGPAPTRAPSGEAAATPDAPIRSDPAPAAPTPGRSTGAPVPRPAAASVAPTGTTTTAPPVAAAAASTPSRSSASAALVDGSTRASLLPPAAFVGLAALAAVLWAGRRPEADVAPIS